MVTGPFLAGAALDKISETFVVCVAALKASSKMTIYLSRAAQVFTLRKTAQLATMQRDKAHIEIPAEYTDYADVFSSDLALELLENTNINEYTIKLIKDKLPPYRPIYALNSMELETLKAYIETYLTTGFIQSSKSLVGAQ